MSFLIGLNDSFTHIRGQISLMDLLPPINKVFALISQDERQKNMSSQLSISGDLNNGMTFAIKTGNNHGLTDHRLNMNQKSHPLCTHCNFHGHTIDKCYKLHGYPPCYKSKPKFQSSNDTQRSVVNQLSTFNGANVCTERNDVPGSHSSSQIAGLTPDICQQLITLLSAQINSNIQISQQNESTNQLCHTGPMQQEDDWLG